MLWVQRNAYEESTIKRIAKELKHLLKNCNFNNPEDVKLYISKKKCGNAYKENLIESYAVYMRSINQTWEQPFYERYDKKRKAPKEELADFITNNARFEMKLKNPSYQSKRKKGRGSNTKKEPEPLIELLYQEFTKTDPVEIERIIKRVKQWLEQKQKYYEKMSKYIARKFGEKATETYVSKAYPSCIQALLDELILSALEIESKEPR